MVKYEFAKSDDMYVGYGVVCTNRDELASLIVDLGKEEPKIKIEWDIKRNGPYMIHLGEVPNSERIRWWLVKWFCDRGWEPFSHYRGVHNFKRITEQI